MADQVERIRTDTTQATASTPHGGQGLLITTGPNYFGQGTTVVSMSNSGVVHGTYIVNAPSFGIDDGFLFLGGIVRIGSDIIVKALF